MKGVATRKTNYDRLSRYYDLMANRSERKHRDFATGKLGVHEGETILEIGFGTGHSIEAFARRVGNTGKVLGIDSSEGMREVTRARIARAGLEDRVALELEDATSLPYDAGSVDAIFASFTLELFDAPEIQLVLRECYRVLREGGRIVILAMAKRKAPNLMSRLYEWLHNRFPKTIDCRPIYVREALEAAGFTTVELVTRSLCTIPIDVVLSHKAEQRQPLIHTP
jgi:demethylmenaquinone methyltransferase/2-methoxy-6-polyprenyl-1,4-benzoquinol methylase